MSRTRATTRGRIDFRRPVSDDSLNEGLVAWFKACEVPGSYGGNFWWDLTGRNIGTLTPLAPNGPTWQAARHVGGRGSMLFDGVDDYVDAPALKIATNQATFTAWINSQNSSVAYTGIVFSRDPTQPVGMNYYLSTKNLGYTWNNNSSSTYSWTGGPVIPDNQWVLVAVSISPTSATAYVCSSGTCASGVNNITHYVQTFNSDMLIGWDSYSNERHFNGYIDDVRIYNRALSGGEVAALYADGLMGNARTLRRRSSQVIVPLAVAPPPPPTTNHEGIASFVGARARYGAVLGARPRYSAIVGARPKDSGHVSTFP